VRFAFLREPPEPFGVEVTHFCQFAGVHRFGDNGNPQVEWFVQAVFHFKASRFSERHREEAVTNPFIGEADEPRVEVDGTETAAEEIADRRLNAWRLFSIPVNAQDGFPPSQKLLRRNRDEQTFNHRRSSQLKDCLAALRVNGVFLKGQFGGQANWRCPLRQDIPEGFHFLTAQRELKGSHF